MRSAWRWHARSGARSHQAHPKNTRIQPHKSRKSIYEQQEPTPKSFSAALTRRYNGIHQEKIRTKIQNHCLQRLQGQRAETHEGADHHCAIIRAKAWHPAICHGGGRAHREKVQVYRPYFTTVCNGKISEQHLILFVNQMPTDLWFSP